MVQKINTRQALGYLVVLISIAYIPFLHLRVLRMAGDEKVYTSQAIEMARNHSWFVQTLANEPSYFKGPLHYIFLRLGMFLFGNSLLAATWMNFLFALAAAFALFLIPSKPAIKLLLAIAMALNVGVYSHAFASQMEVELCAFFAFATAALYFRRDLLFWVIAGACGWIKSPIHSLLLGLSGILYWSLIGSLKWRLQSIWQWCYLLVGIFVSIAGYLPAIILDFKNFFETFIIRENIQKPNNNRHWDYVTIPLLYFCLPWTGVFLAGLFRIFKRQKTNLAMTKLGFAIMVPSLVFWILCHYKGQNYNLPVMAGLLIFSFGCFSEMPSRFAWVLIGILCTIVFIAFIYGVAHFWPLPDWWNRWWLVFSIFTLAITCIVFLFSSQAKLIAIGATTFFLFFVSVIAPLGEHEMDDAREYLTRHPSKTLYYYNLDPSIWSEWGLLQLTLHRPVYGLHKPEALSQIQMFNSVLVVQDKKILAKVLSATQMPVSSLRVTTWRRWLTKGKTPDGQSHWGEAWRQKSFSPLERSFYIIEF